MTCHLQVIVLKIISLFMFLANECLQSRPLFGMCSHGLVTYTLHPDHLHSLMRYMYRCYIIYLLIIIDLYPMCTFLEFDLYCHIWCVGSACPASRWSYLLADLRRCDEKPTSAHLRNRNCRMVLSTIAMLLVLNLFVCRTCVNAVSWCELRYL